jgi:hypothetical protein
MNDSSKVSPAQERIQYAIVQLKKHNIEFSMKNDQTGHFHCRKKSNDELIQYWATTGKILGHKNLGIHNLIKLLTKRW